MIPTAEEFLDQEEYYSVSNDFDTQQAMVKFAKLHVEAFRQNLLTNHLELWDDCEVTTKECIENAYSLDNIK